MAAHHLVNSVDRTVIEGLEGLVMTHTDLSLVDGQQVVVRSDIEDIRRSGKVAVLSGGGAGHEPSFGGFVGRGMLSGAVAGAVFTSPPPGAILEAMMQLGKDNPGGVLVNVLNYTGDRINFGLALERARASGIKADMLVCHDDTALESDNKTAGRRGLAASVLLNKITGAMAEENHSLESIVNTGQKVVENAGTIGICLSPCSIPGRGPSFTIPTGKYELGKGVHGEPGVRLENTGTAKQIVKVMLDHLAEKADKTSLTLTPREPVVLVTNNLGGTSVLELNIMTREAVMYLQDIRKVCVLRVFSGPLITSLDMGGLSLTILRIKDLKWLDYLDAPCSAPGWCNSFSQLNPDAVRHPIRYKEPMLKVETTAQETDAVGMKLSQTSADEVRDALRRICCALEKARSQLDELDKSCGDADCGTTHYRGAKAILADLQNLNFFSPNVLLLQLSSIVESKMGGSSGGLYSLALSAAAASFVISSESGIGSQWVAALDAGIAAMCKYGGAALGDRTMLDALIPFAQSLRSGDSVKKAAEITSAAADATKTMIARAGRASYTAREKQNEPDPGAVAVAIMATALASIL